MIPFPVPPGTTVDTLLTELLPKEHAARVDPASKTDPIVGVLVLAGSAGKPDRAFTFTVRGAKLEVREGEAAVRDTWMRVDAAIADVFVREWSEGAGATPSELAKKAPMPTDPKLLRRVQMVSGRIELALRDFTPRSGEAGGAKIRASMTIASGAAAKKAIESGRADVTIETNASTLEDLVAGKMGPDAALGDDRVAVQGKRLLAMQFALAVGPFFPLAAKS